MVVGADRYKCGAADQIVDPGPVKGPDNFSLSDFGFI